MTVKKPFWKYSLMGRAHDFGMFWPEVALAQQALFEKRTVHTFFHQGTLREGVDINTFVERVIAHGGHVMRHSYPATRGGDEEWTVVTDTWAFNIDYTHKNRLTALHIHSTDSELMPKLVESAKGALTRKVTRGRAYIVVQADQGPYLHEMGTAGETFIPENYRPEVIEGYRHIVADMNSDDPCGRIVILDGPPGTGKTHMVRALLNEVPKGTFVLIPSNMMSQLGSPSFIKAILREQRKGYPMILIVEDADEAISSRDRANMSEISALLNFSDGIFGAMLDLRIVATTNVDIEALDEAVMRPGRLCKRIEVGKLDEHQAGEIYARLTEGKGTHVFKKGFYTLGEIYFAARGNAATGAPKKKTRSLGFSVEQSPEPTPAQDVGMQPGEYGTTDTGELVVVRDDGQFEMVGKVEGNPRIGSRWEDVKKELGIDDDDDDDLIDEDPEETPLLEDEDDE